MFLNRRGYAPVLHCAACCWKSACPNCSAWRVFHKIDRTLRCHHCGLAERVPRACPDCGNLDIAAIGRGTERLEEQLAQALPGARIARIDADTTRRKGALQAQLDAVHAGDVDVLVGTQMIAKGHDFRRITLVAAVNPDAALFSVRLSRRRKALRAVDAGRGPRRARRVARRAQRDVGADVAPEARAVRGACARTTSAPSRAGVLREREMAGLPPYSHLALLRAEARTLDAARDFLQAASDAAGSPPRRFDLCAGADEHAARGQCRARADAGRVATSRPALQQFLAQWSPSLHALRGAHKALLRWAIDVDPLGI